MSATPPLNASSRIMYAEAQSRGIECTTFGDKETILMNKNGQQWYVRGSRTSLHSSIGKTIADNKGLTKKILNYFKLPTAKGVVVKQPFAELSEVEGLQFPVVVKPLDARHGQGVRVGVRDVAEVSTILSKESGSWIVEEMLNGVEYRILCIDFKFVAAAFRKPAFVVGDGSSTISQLIAKKNEHPWRGEGHENNLSLIVVDELVEAYVQEQGLTLESVPTRDQEVMLRKTANLSTGGEAWNVSDQVCEENKRMFEAIAKACDINVAGIDIMCESLQTPLTEQPLAGVIEVNASPGLRMHHFPLQGEPVNAAGLILDMVAKAYHL
jgi:cyanophycin synthetase